MKTNNSSPSSIDIISNYNDLKVIKGVKFTPREVDVIACLLSGRGAKTIGQFLSIEEKTVETHKYNVMRKLDTNFKEGIIEFIEKSDKFSALKNHYLHLLREAILLRSLQKISSFTKRSNMECILIYENSENEFSKRLETHLNHAGIKTKS